MIPLLSPHLSWHCQHLTSTTSTMEAIVLPPSPIAVSLVWADEQTEGRGQRGTHWESQVGENLLFSFAFRPTGVKAHEQFLLSQITALALVDTLQPLTEGITIKWPNDIYHNHHKLSGMLLYHSLSGSEVASTLVGIGLNVNQLTFHSDAPNPISLRQITGRRHSRWELLQAFIAAFRLWCQMPRDHIAQRYKEQLYRRKGLHLYQDVKRQLPFRARLHDIAPNGLLTLIDEQGQQRSFAFKEVSFL